MADQFPRGKLNADDEGELQMKIGTRDKTVIIDFGKPVVWLGLDYHTAMNLAANIIKRAQEVKPKTECQHMANAGDHGDPNCVLCGKEIR